MILRLRQRRAVLAGLVLAAALSIVFLWIKQGWNIPISAQTPAVTFVVLFVLLPLIGFPISVFLVLLGVKFDPAPALLILLCTMAAHQLIMFAAGNTLLRPLVEKIMARNKLRMPQLPAEGYLWPCLVFMAVPGLSYTMKNYMLSLSGIPFGGFFLIAWPVQALRAIPMVLVGGTLASGHYGLLSALVGLVGICGLFQFWMVRRRRSCKIRAARMNENGVE